ncbi:integrator complex subunit 3 homolog [Agrilus planipennis]|uniref:SOSS complex subunit A homolog n=1 Tax=Agrilus planipennis TaxID=224129 RepID=A0A7F5QXH4_AGRPL|nr:integrator complex subunit 3 homolog [Agrilus planipennis]
MEQAKNQPSRLFLTSPVENKDDLEEKLERSYQTLQSLTSGLSDKDAHDALNNALLKEKGYEEVSFGLLVSILTEPQNASKSYRDLTLITRDGFGLVLTHLSQLVLEKYLKFKDVAKSQLIWLVREMIKNSVTNVDNLCWNLMRHAAGGDTSIRNVTLVESLLDIYIEYRNWLEKFPVLLASVVYTYLRLLEDHNAPYLSNLKQKEVNFLINLLREKFYECLVIGRDLVRLLQNVARIPEFEQLWRDILLTPKSLCPSFTGILQLLQMRTSRRFLQSRLTPEMEKKLVFLTSQVRFGNHKRYQEWFQRQYLATPESQSLRCDMIRFIVGVIHPTNELLCSDIIPRWAVIGWLLTTCTSTVAVSNAKLALFYDWLFYDSEKDNIMNIEPAILVMHHSMRSHPAVSATLLDFLCRIIANFYPPLSDKVRAGIFSSLRQILDKRVLSSLLPLFDNSKLDRELRLMVRETFKEFCSSSSESSSKMDDCLSSQGSKLDDGDMLHVRTNNSLNNHILEEPAFSDEEDDQSTPIHAPEEDTDDDDIPLAKVRLKEKTVDNKNEEFLLKSTLRTLLSQLQNEKMKEKRCELTERLIDDILNTDIEPEALRTLAEMLYSIIQTDLKEDVLPKELTQENLLESIRSPLFTLFKSLYNFFKKEDESKDQLLKLISEIYNFFPSVGYLLLYFLKIQVRTESYREDVSKLNSLKTSVYKEFCHSVEKKLDMCLLDDLTTCHVNDTTLMCWIVPDLYKDFKQQMINNAQILRVIVSAIDAKQLQEFIFLVMQGQLVMFKIDNLQSLLKTSLSWETIEQFFLWQLLQAHDITMDAVIPLISSLDPNKHPEALTAITLMSKQDKPNADVIKYLFSRDVLDDDNFGFSMLKYWCEDYLDKISDFVSNLLCTRYPQASPTKRKRSSNKSISASVPSADQVLGHLEQIRHHCEVTNDDTFSLFSTESMQRALQLAYSNSSDSQKKQFNKLFSLAEEEEDVVTSKSRSQARGRKAANKPAPKRAVTKGISDTSEESSEDEDFVMPKQAKKRKKVVSDSD